VAVGILITLTLFSLYTSNKKKGNRSPDTRHFMSRFEKDYGLVVIQTLNYVCVRIKSYIIQRCYALLPPLKAQGGHWFISDVI